MRDKILLILLLLPLVVPLGLIFYHSQNGGQEWRIGIQGYDPRDLLRGRYIQFRYDLGNEEEIRKAGGICLNGDRNAPVVTAGKKNCEAFIPYTRSLFETKRFYIPEHLADEADRIVRKNTEEIRAGIIIQRNDITLKNLYYRDVEILSYIKEKRNE